MMRSFKRYLAWLLVLTMVLGNNISVFANMPMTELVIPNNESIGGSLFAPEADEGLPELGTVAPWEGEEPSQEDNLADESSGDSSLSGKTDAESPELGTDVSLEPEVSPEGDNPANENIDDSSLTPEEDGLPAPGTESVLAGEGASEGKEIAPGAIDEPEIEPSVQAEPLMLTALAGGVKVTATAAVGVLPPGTELSVYSFPEEEAAFYADIIEGNTGTRLEDYLVFDITFFDRDGQEIQPQGEVTVSFSDVYFAKEGEEILAYHVELDKPQSTRFSLFGLDDINDNYVVNSIAAENENDEVFFDADHFSIYAIGTTPTATYEFYDGGNLIETQIVKNSEKLLEPPTPEMVEGRKFIGWFIDGDTQAISFDWPISVAETKIYRVDARYDDVFYVYFIYNNNIIATRAIPPGGKASPEKVPLIVNIPEKAFKHWSEEQNGAVGFDFNQVVSKNTTLYAVLEDKLTVDFNSCGGTTVAPIYVIKNNTLGTTKQPERTGYTFSGWYTDKNGGGTKYDNNTVVTRDTQLYAKWTPKTVNYAIVYWQENADDDNYTYKETATGSGLSGATITLSGNTIKSTKYDYFTYKKYDTGKTINGDGSTVINVYYARNTYKVEFKLIPSSGTKPSSANLIIGGVTYPHTTNYSFTAKYESDISGLWPTAANIADVGNYKFYAWSGSNPTVTQVSKVLRLTTNYLSTSGTKTFTGSWSTSLSEYTLHYMIESLDSNSGEKQYNNKWYNENMAYSQVANASGNWSAKQLPGVTAVSESGFNETIEGKTHVFFYYSRNTYKLEFFNNSQTAAKAENLKFGASIAGQNYTPPRPSGINELWTYKGWYTTPNGLEGSKFDFTGKVMPENNLALYAKWSPPIFEVKFYLLIDDASGPQTIEVDYRSTISDAQLDKYLPTGMGEEQFVGWYWFVGDEFLPYDFDTPIDRNDIVLYPIWTTPPLCKVEYASGGAVGSVPVDNGSYTVGSSAGVLAPNDLVAPDGLVFIGWKEDSTNKVYYPNDKLLVKDAVMTLTAQWGERPSSTVLLYNGNGGKSSEGNNTISYLLPLNNETHTVIPGNSFARAEYVFVQWNTKADGTGTAFAPGDEIVVDNNNEANNILYAIWKTIPVGSELDFKSYTGEYNGNPHQPELVKADGLDIADVVSYSTDGGTNWTTVKPEFTDAGDYEVVVKVTNPNYKDREETVTVNITPKAATITVDNQSKKYGASDPELTGTVEGLVNSNDLGTINYSRATGENVGDYSIDASYTANSNYAVSVEKGNLAITKATAEEDISVSAADVTYDGNKHSVSIDGLKAGDTVEYSTDGGKTWVADKPEYSDAGDYEVQVKVTNPNYEDRTGSATVTISPKEVTVTVDNASKILGKDDPAFTGTVTGMVDGDDLGLSYKRTNDTENAAGAYPEVITAEINNKNYTLKVEKGDFQILRASLAATKTAVHEDTNGNGKPDVGEKIHYTITITNTGDIALSDVKVVDEMLDMDITVINILPGKSQTLTESYILTQKEIDDGLITNTVTATGKDTDGDPVTTEKEVKVETILEQESQLSVEKVGTLDDLNGNKMADAGETITYTITVKNTGNTTLKNVNVKDAMLGLDETIAELLPGADREFTQDYVTKQDDIDGGQVRNEITVTATDPNGNTITEEKEIFTPAEQVPGMQVEKTGHYVDVNGDGQANVGDRIDYTITVTNTGNVTLTDIKIVDTKIDLDVTISTLLPGASQELTGSHTLIQADMDSGLVTNKVTAEGKDSKGDPVTTEKTIETPLAQKSKLSVEKAGSLDDLNGNKMADAGETITYTITVKNTGNTTVKAIKVVDPMLDLDETIAELLPGADWKHEQAYEIKQDDIDGGQVRNEITVTATDPNGNTITEEKEIYTPAEQVSGLQVEKTGHYVDVNGDGLTNVGDRIDYTITIKNTGNITLTGTKVVDEMIGLDITVATLLPGTSKVFTGSHTLTAADLYKGSVENSVSVKSQDPNGDPVNTEKTITTPLAIELKVSGENTIYDGEKHSPSVEGLIEGDEVYYSTDGGKDLE